MYKLITETTEGDFKTHAEAFSVFKNVSGLAYVYRVIDSQTLKVINKKCESGIVSDLIAKSKGYTIIY